MPRQARITLPHVPLHVVQRGNNRQACFFSADDYRRYLDWLAEHAEITGCRIHAYVLMTNHIHLLLSAEQADSPAAMMKALSQRYVQYVNRFHRRTGTLWEGRYRSSPVQEEGYFLTCQRYIELNPVRAGIVAHPADYRWTSYHANGLGISDDLVTTHSVYERLAPEKESRLAAYRALFAAEFPPGALEGIRQATAGNLALGHPEFAACISAAAGRRAARGAPGRPKKSGQI
jgi:putative transposase